MRVAILTGGPSSERKQSLDTCAEVAWALEQLGYTFKEFDIAQQFANDLLDFDPDVAFMSLSGGTGENGSIQGMMEVMEIPYTHSGVFACAAAMNKEMSKSIFRAAGLPVPDGGLFHKDVIQKDHVLATPYVVKPNDEGSSLGGIQLIMTANEKPPFLGDTQRSIFLVEEYIPGRELTASVLGDQSLAITQFDIEGLYGYDQKYHELDHNHILPAPLPSEIEAHILDLTLQAHDALGCRGLTRTDFRWDEDRGLEGLYILELNAIPGLRRNSSSGRQAAYRGIDFPDLIEWIVKDASLER